MELALPQNWDVAFFKNTVGNKGLRCREEVKAARGGKLELLLLSVFTLPQSGAGLKSATRRCGCGGGTMKGSGTHAVDACVLEDPSGCICAITRGATEPHIEATTAHDTTRAELSS